VLSESVRMVDTIGRHSRDQFMLLTPGPEGPLAVERIVRGVAGRPRVKGQAVSVSAGVASFPMDGRTPEELVAAAESAVAAASQAGGGRVVAPQPTKD
jgi:GGDEF domain-containing protein